MSDGKIDERLDITTESPTGFMRFYPTVIMEPTMYLRFSKDGRLQQAWRNMNGPEVEWRDVPTEGEEDGR